MEKSGAFAQTGCTALYKGAASAGKQDFFTKRRLEGYDISDEKSEFDIVYEIGFLFQTHYIIDIRRRASLISKYSFAIVQYCEHF